MMDQHFPPTSRYAQVASVTLITPDGAEIVYLARRFLPHPERLALLQEHTVSDGERLDNVSFAYLGDPEQFWRLCDANRVMHPDELMAVGRTLRITLPDGIPGAPHA